jgi:flavodoxin
MDVLIVHDGQSGRTRKAAEAMARTAAASGAEATVKSVEVATPDDAAQADVLVAGCWVKGKVPFGDAQASRMASWIEGLPALDGKPAGAFCTYRGFPLLFADAVARTGETLNRLKAGLEAKGADVVATHTVDRDSPDRGVAEFVAEVLQQVEV